MSGPIESHRPLRLVDLPEERRTSYPESFAAAVSGRWRRRLGDAFGLSDFGVNLTRLEPGSATALRHWHTHEDELVITLEGEATLVTEAGETAMGPGTCVGFRKGVADGHQLINRSQSPVVLLEISARRPDVDEVFYPDVDLRCLPGRIFAHRDGTPWETA